MAMRMPAAGMVAAIAAVVGAAVGGGIAALEAAVRPWRAGDFAVNAIDAVGPRPVCEVPDTLFAFGTVAVGGKGSHEFVIRNTGDAPLELTKGATSCSCTVSDFEESEGGSSNAKVIAPGGSTVLKVQWRGKGEGGAFRQQATVLTNDPGGRGSRSSSKAPWCPRSPPSPRRWRFLGSPPAAANGPP